MTPHHTRTRLIVAATTLAVGFVLGTFSSKLIASSKAAPLAAASPAPAVSAAPTSTVPPAMAAHPVDFSGIVEQFGPAVVNVSVTGKAQKFQRFPGFPVDPDDPFFQFFQQFGPVQQAPQQIVPHGLGSGFIVSADGVVLTNAHVVNDAEEVVVKLTDRREFRAKVLGADRRSDVAVLKIDAKDLPTVVLGDPNQTRVGEPVLAIGAPFGFENSATAGIVSAKSRTLKDDPYVSFMQTDVAVNPGNSGGPLFNLRGEVIGINSQIYSQTGGYQGLSFAIPIDVAKKVEEQLVSHGKVSRGRLGLAIQDINADLAESFGLKRAQGALVATVEHGSPAESAGVKTGDVITAVDAHQIDHAQDLTALISATRPGSSVELSILRDRKPLTVRARVGELDTVAEEGGSKDQELSSNRFGLTVRPATPQESGTDGGGVVVVATKGAAAQAGIRRGDVILSLNDTPVNSPAELKETLDKANRRIALLIQRGNQRRFVAVDVG